MEVSLVLEKIALVLLGALLSLLGTFIFHRWSGRNRELATLETLDVYIRAISARLYNNLDVSQKDLWADELESFVSGPRMPVSKVCIPLREIARRIRSHSCAGDDPDYDPDFLLADLYFVRLATLSRPRWFDFRQQRRAMRVLAQAFTNVWGVSMTEPVDKQYRKWLHGQLRLGNEFAAADLINGKVDEAFPNKQMQSTQ
jgi:hypothetical protein